MKKNRNYLTNELVFTRELIEKYKLLKTPFPEEEMMHELNDILQTGTKFLTNRLNDQVEQAINSSKSKARYYMDGKFVFPTNLIPREILHDYLISQLNHIFKFHLNEFENDQAFHKETENEETAFFINLNSLIIDYHHNRVKTDPHPNKVLQDYNETLYDLKNDKNLTQKLIKNKKKRLFKTYKKLYSILECKSN